MGPVQAQSSYTRLRTRTMESPARRGSGRGGSAESGAEAARPCSNRPRESLPPPLPQRGDEFTEDQMLERFGVPRGGSVRASAASPDVILVRKAHGDCGIVEENGPNIYDIRRCDGGPNHASPGSPRLARSLESGSRVMYFVKECERLAFNGIVGRVARRRRDDSPRPDALAFEMETVDAAAPRGGAGAGRKGGATPTAATTATEEASGILGMSERISADLDNDRPYSAEIERRIADCEAGRPIGKTHTGEERPKHPERERGTGALERPG